MKDYESKKRIKIEADNKYLSFKGNAHEAIYFVDYMRDCNRELNNNLSDFLFNIEKALQDAGVYDEHFNLIEQKDQPELYSGVLKSGAEIMLRKNGDNEWTVDVRDTNDEYILGYQFCDYDQALGEYNKLEKNFNKYPFLDGDCYWVIENGQVVEATWDNLSDEDHDENPDQVYYSSECDAVDAYKLMLLDFLETQKESSFWHDHKGFYASAIKLIK